ncbi:hypothetical protein J3E72DRAFT_380222 [Bipolaris maydis]|nr:hypothetical protein BM1_10906 [Bipolaris maydis]KAJ6192118.1 hypothetical protein J3E72DRAFT_380222 [Bipolaris maydis]KAJ6284329.1 hypothetical protein J3E71DRAFT_172212 [Bipolaris maydis]
MSAWLWTALPAELREQVYAYVLTAPSGLIYRTGTDGVDRICSRAKQVVKVNTFGGHLLESTYYLYYNLVAVFRRATIASEELEFNQIQYVSRQCYRESHGLEFRYNNILFEDSGNMSAGQRCRIFVNKVMKQRYAQYLNLSIRGSGISFQPPGSGSSPITLAQFFLQHPEASLKLYHPFWSQRNPGFLLLGLAYATAIRGHELLERLVREQGPTLDFNLALIRSMLPKEGMPLNFRLAPWEESLDMSAIHELLEQSLFPQSENSPIWLDIVESWFSEGL